MTTYRVIGWSDETEKHDFQTRREAVAFVKGYLDAWMESSDRIGWYYNTTADPKYLGIASDEFSDEQKPDMAYVLTEAGEITDAWAHIEVMEADE